MFRFFLFCPSSMVVPIIRWPNKPESLLSPKSWFPVQPGILMLHRILTLTVQLKNARNIYQFVRRRFWELTTTACLSDNDCYPENVPENVKSPRTQYSSPWISTKAINQPQQSVASFHPTIPTAHFPCLKRAHCGAVQHLLHHTVSRHRPDFSSDYMEEGVHFRSQSLCLKETTDPRQNRTCNQTRAPKYVRHSTKHSLREHLEDFQRCCCFEDKRVALHCMKATSTVEGKS